VEPFSQCAAYYFSNVCVGGCSAARLLLPLSGAGNVEASVAGGSTSLSGNPHFLSLVLLI